MRNGETIYFCNLIPKPAGHSGNIRTGCRSCQNLIFQQVHHDGTNHYLYRVFKRGVTESQIDRLKGKILDGTATRRDITRVTNRLGDAIGKVYGWSFPREVKEHER